MVQQHAATFFAQAEAAVGADLPQFVKDEFDAFLECGILAHGFLRLRCGDCGHDKHQGSRGRQRSRHAADPGAQSRFVPSHAILVFQSSIEEQAAMSAVSIRLPDDVSTRLADLAQRTGRSKTFYMVEAIREHLDDLEDLYLAERELEAVRSGKSKLVPLEEVMKRYGMAT